MSWLSLSLHTDAEHAEPLCDALLEAGALSATIEDADLGTPEEQAQFDEPGSIVSTGWRRSRVIALLAEEADPLQCLSAAVAALGLPDLPDFSVGRVEPQNWVQLTQSQFDPIRIASRLWIVPSWHSAPDPSAINLVLDPGMAFGTGSHPTTRLCLEWLEQNLLPGETLLDYGCGSGILAIAAARLGAREVHGLDIDPQAVQAARDNAATNQVQACFEVASTAAEGSYDRVVANILANPLRLLAPAITARVRPGGFLALSGILETQAEELMACYRPWIQLDIGAVLEGWVCLTGQKSSVDSLP